MVIGGLNKLSKTVLSQKHRGKAKFFGISYELKGGFSPLTTSVSKSTLLYPWNPTGESRSLLAADTIDEEDRSSPIDGFTDRATVFSLLSVEAETALIDDIA
uniref:Uncharacterized protein n=1 Tax=Vespula pensylvanica TaxID=30213 RepID=A0A834P488_VESPE|nr:hypothetical protein H0235_007075 [Vespula pensylvanica]